MTDGNCFFVWTGPKCGATYRHRLHTVGLSGKIRQKLNLKNLWNWLILPMSATNLPNFNINLINLLETKILRVGWKIHEITSNNLNLFLAGFIHLKPLWYRQQALCMRIWKQASFIKLFHSHLFSTELVTRVFSLKPLRVFSTMGLFVCSYDLGFRHFGCLACTYAHGARAVMPCVSKAFNNMGWYQFQRSIYFLACQHLIG